MIRPLQAWNESYQAMPYRAPLAALSNGDAALGTSASVNGQAAAAMHLLID
jgi:hypothetical protein